MQWTLQTDGSLLSETDEANRYGLVFPGERVRTQARQSYEPYAYYGYITRKPFEINPRVGDNLVSWGSMESAMTGVEDTLARFRQRDADGV